jgi:1-acyl-sn-glycerol-3-phosphate acyltransferase
MPLPPIWIRRLVIAPLVVVLSVTALVSLPLILVVAALLTTFTPGRWRPVRFAWFLFLYLALEAITLIVLLVVWVATGFGLFIHAPWSQRLHYRIVGLVLGILEFEAGRVLNVSIVSDGATPDDLRHRPLIVLARHAGAGDSFLLVETLVNWYDREPRIVLKSALQWDPALDVLLNRLPTRFVGTGSSEETLADIRELTRDLDEDDAFVIFPEGGNFTTARRLKSIQWLRDHGFDVRVRAAEDMQTVLAPREAGTVAALTAGSHADVAIVAHTGLEHLSSIKAIWRYLPMDTEIKLHWEHVPAEDVPRDPAAIGVWLYEWWGVIDRWVRDNRPAVVEAAYADPAVRSEPAPPPSPPEPMTDAGD